MEILKEIEEMRKQLEYSSKAPISRLWAFIIITMAFVPFLIFGILALLKGDLRGLWAFLFLVFYGVILLVSEDRKYVLDDSELKIISKNRSARIPMDTINEVLLYTSSSRFGTMKWWLRVRQQGKEERLDFASSDKEDALRFFDFLKSKLGEAKVKTLSEKLKE